MLRLWFFSLRTIESLPTSRSLKCGSTIKTSNRTSWRARECEIQLRNLAHVRTSRGRRYTRSETPAWSSQPIGSRGKTATGGRILQAGRCQRERVAHGSLEIRMLACATRRCHCRSPGTTRSCTSLARPRTPRENAGTTILNDDSVQPAWPALRMGLSTSQ